MEQEGRKSNLPNNAQRSHFLISLQRNRNFVGRTNELERLEGQLFKEDQCSRIAVTGLGGVGKTQAALEFAYRTRDKYPHCSVFWIPALSFESVRQAYLDIAKELGIRGSEHKDENFGELVRNCLSQSNIRPWLIIVDNADDLETFLGNAYNNVGLIDILPKNNGSSIILTSRSRKTAVRFASDNVIHVSALDEDTALELLRHSLIDRSILQNKKLALDLLALLTYLPLAITQAAAYINQNNMAVTEYISLLNSQEEEIIDVLSEEFEDEGRYRDLKNPIALTWLVSFEQISSREPLAAEYLSFMSCLDPKAIPQSLLPPAPMKKKEIDAIGLLSAYSFISKRSTSNVFDLHQLVHLATRNWLRRQGKLCDWTNRAISRMADVFPSSEENNRTLWRSYLVHAQKIQNSANFQINTWDGLPLLRHYLPLFRRYGECLLQDGRWTEAEATFSQQVEVASSFLGQEDPFTLTSMTDLAFTRGRQGKWDETIHCLEQISKTQERVLGSNHLDLLITVGYLATFYAQCGCYETAEKLSIEILERYRPILGDDNPYILGCRNTLAVIYFKQGHFKESLTLLLQIFDRRKKVLGSKHPKTLQSMSSLSLLYVNRGLANEAIELGLQALKWKEDVLGQEHPDILINLQYLAVAHNFIGQQRKALDYGEYLVDLSSKVNGNRHPDTLRGISTLAMIYVGLEKWDKSEELLLDAKKGLGNITGPDHPDNMGVIFALFMQYSMQSRLAEAEELAVSLLEQRQRATGSEYPGKLIVMDELANIRKRQGCIEEAYKMKRACLLKMKSSLGVDHDFTVACENDLENWQSTSPKLQKGLMDKDMQPREVDVDQLADILESDNSLLGYNNDGGLAYQQGKLKNQNYIIGQL